MELRPVSKSSRRSSCSSPGLHRSLARRRRELSQGRLGRNEGASNMVFLFPLIVPRRRFTRPVSNYEESGGREWSTDGPSSPQAVIKDTEPTGRCAGSSGCDNLQG